MKRLLCTLLASCGIVIALFAQSEDERLTRAMYNRIEFFFNSQQTDSIYALASPEFKQQISSAQFNTAFSQLYALGKIKNATMLDYEKGIAHFKADFDSKTLTVLVGLDKTKRLFATLVFRPYSGEEEPAQLKEVEGISNVEKTDRLDFLIDSLARPYVQQQHAKALAVAVIHRNQVKKYFYGETDEQSGRTPDENSIFEIGSITKTFTATLLADLVEKGTISLEDTISAFLPDSLKQNPSIAKITFRTLANHTSGLPRLPDNLTSTAGYDEKDPYAHYDRAALFAFLKNVQTSRAPEEEYEYSNVGYGLLAELLAIISQKSYEDLLRETILTPLHMKSTAVNINPKSEFLLPVYNVKGQKVPHWNFKALAGTGGLKSTTDDMLRYAIVQLRRPDSPLEQAMALTKLFTYFIPPNTDIGLGWHMNMIEDVTCYWHNGGTGGSSSFIGLIPDMDSAVIVLSNSALSVDDMARKMITTVINAK